MKRRDFLTRLGLGAGAALFGPSLLQMVAEAQGQEDAGARASLMVLTDGNGWSHQASPRNAVSLDTNVRSETDWDLPATLAPLAPFGERVSIVRQLQNHGDRDLHGNGWATLSGVSGDRKTPGGISIDRLVALQKGRQDPFSSIALGIAVREGKPPACTSADGPQKPFPAISDPLKAHNTLFGAGQGQHAMVSNALDQEKSLLDAMVQDTKKVQAALAGRERARFDQLLTSYRELELRIKKQQGAPQGAPMAPQEGIRAGLNRQAIEAHIDIIASALAFGLTHVAHLSLLGMNAHNVGWGFLNFGGDAHESVAHVAGGYSKEKSTQAYFAVIQFKAQMLARLYTKLQAYQVGDRTLAEQTLFMWVNSGGGKHHHGSDYHAMVTIGDAGPQGGFRMGRYLDMPFKKHTVNQAFLSVAKSMGVEIDHFGDKEHCPEPLPGLL